MTLPDTAREVAPWIATLARIGYVAKAILYATIGVLAAQAALGRGGRTTDTSGALREVVRAPMGDALLLVIALVGRMPRRQGSATTTTRTPGSSCSPARTARSTASSGVRE